ncbi:MAG: winged helix-turn-helix domain-containing protein [Tangfeifania sp.]
MLESLITSKTRVKILFKLFLNSESSGHLRELEKEFNESSNSIRLELNRLVKAGLLSSFPVKNKKVYKANTRHPLYNSINSMLRKVVGIDQLIIRVTSQIGNLDLAYLIGEFAAGHDSDTLELALVGTNLDRQYIDSLVGKAEKMIDRKIVYMIFTPEQMAWFLKDRDKLLIWKNEEAENGKPEAGNMKKN